MKTGLIGLGVMGRNLGLNLRDAGHVVSAWDPWPQARDWRADGIIVPETIEQFVQSLSSPRTILMMVKSGDPVSNLCAELSGLLHAGDIVIDGGNSAFGDTEHNGALLAGHGIRFAGLGISGGAEGARHGPSMMLGCNTDLKPVLMPLLQSIAAQHEETACVGWFGRGGAGHFVKMVHNGIEYAVMEAIAECWQLLAATGHTPSSAGQAMADWRSSGPGGYLLDISSEVLQTADPVSGQPLIDMVDDAAGQKGTGSWCVAAALELGVPVPAIAEAVTMRQISSHRLLRDAHAAGSPEDLPDLPTTQLGHALTGTVATILKQGSHLLDAASHARGWSIDPAEAARVWRAGSILRMNMLDILGDVTQLDETMDRHAGDLRHVTATAVEAGIPVPVLASCLGYFDACSSRRLPTALVQLQRDRFGAHGLKSRSGTGDVFHGPWHGSTS